jgi:vacuolar-type H+-ATPase subunit I/STV1
MADAMNPMGPMSQPTVGQPTARTVDRRPGLVTFAAVIMFLIGAFQLTWALVEFSNAAWISANVYGSFGGYLWIWGIFDVLFALVLFYAGYDILAGGTFGQTFGIVFAGFNAIRWFFYLPAAPWLAIVMIILDVIVIYGLVSHSDFFQNPQRL